MAAFGVFEFGQRQLPTDDDPGLMSNQDGRTNFIKRLSLKDSDFLIEENIKNLAFCVNYQLAQLNDED